ncbi:MAG: Trm112 family protein [Candidatus Woesearchaeota archaeon]|jgi:hypothetical protein|nr:Trm112 family protein [Candidatus Woesearchaeota archaeon]MDP7323458.1 Trm112 family protein [Candidatus Woesearchaeota archaeon]MDP7457264.1 Trm112 family protein [Candidatus Woesearchaeota archaeon]
MTHTIPEELIQILACPTCKADLSYNTEKNELICSKCEQSYPVKKGIPILMPKEADN